jgi:GT2 family glycosyltransferase
VLLTDDKPQLLAALGAVPLLEVKAGDAYTFTLPTQAECMFQVYELQDGFLPPQWGRLLLDFRERQTDIRTQATYFGVAADQVELLGVYRRSLHTRNVPTVVPAAAWQGLARRLSTMGATPTRPLDPALPFQSRVAQVLTVMVKGFGQAPSEALNALIQDALQVSSAAETKGARVLSVSATRWKDIPGDDYDALVVHDLAGWSLQNVQGAILSQTLAGMLVGRAQWRPLMQEGLHLLQAQLHSRGRLVVSQCALQADQEHNWGYDPLRQALKTMGGSVVSAWAAWPNDSTWFQWPLLAAGEHTHAVLNVGLAAVGPFFQKASNWPEALQQGQGLALARGWCCVLEPSDSSPTSEAFAMPTADALVYQHLHGEVVTLKADNPLLADRAQTAQVAFFGAASQEHWTFPALGAVFERFLSAVDSLVPQSTLRAWLASSESLSGEVALQLCQAMPDRIGWDRSGAVFWCAPTGASQGEALLESVVTCQQALTAPRWLLASLLVLLRGVPQWGLHEHRRDFTRLQWAENLLAQVGLHCLDANWQQAGIEPQVWLADQALPTPAPGADLQERDARIASLEHQLHYEQTDKNGALEQLAAASEVARGVTADVRRVVTREVAADVRRRVSAEYEASLSWRVSKPLRQAKSLLGRLKRRVAAAPVKPLQKEGPGAVSVPVEVSGAGGLPAVHTWAPPEPSGQFSADYLPRFDYGRWVAAFDQIDEFGKEALRQKWALQDSHLVLGWVFLPTSSMAHLVRLLGDLLGQAYPYWRAVVLVSPETPLDERCSRCIAADERLQSVTLPHGATLSEGLRAGMRVLAPNAGYASALPADARLNCVALSALAEAYQAHPQWEVVYGDVDTLNENGQRCKPFFKPDWNEALFLSSALAPSLQESLISGALWAPPARWERLTVPEEAKLDADGWALAKLAMVLSVDVQMRRGHVGHLARVMSHHPEAHLRTATREKGLDLMRDYFRQREESAELSLTRQGVQIRWPLPPAPALVSLIIPTRNNPKLLSQCVNSILQRTRDVNFEVLIVDNGSDTPQALATLRQLGENPRVQVVRDSSVFNYSALNNHAVSLARGQWVALVNDDIEVMPGHDDWLAEMLRQAARPQVGVVGAKLLYPDGTVQHAGVFLAGTLSWHAFRHFASDDPGHGGLAQRVRNSTCLTAACIVVRKSIYEQVGGLDAEHLTVGWNDTDFCLKVSAAGYQNIWTPEAVLVHHESATRGQDQTPEKKARAEREWRTMQQRWGEKMSVDPAYNPNLSCGYEDFSWAWPPRGVKSTPSGTP